MLGFLTAEQLLASPSRQDGIPQELEERYRREGALFIRDIANQLEL
jgi:hypothetical protein